MLVLSTDFPLDPSCTVDDFLQMIADWVSGVLPPVLDKSGGAGARIVTSSNVFGSARWEQDGEEKDVIEAGGEKYPVDSVDGWWGCGLFLDFSIEKLKDLQQGKREHIQGCDTEIRSTIASSPTVQLVGVQFDELDVEVWQDMGAEKWVGDFDYKTTIVFSKEAGDIWLGIRVECTSKGTSPFAGIPPTTKVSVAANASEHEVLSWAIPPTKKPIFVDAVLASLGGGRDGSLIVKNSAHRLTDDDVSFAAELILSNECYLPIVYISSTGAGESLVLDADQLAKELCGMAHVVVEPNRFFAARLKKTLSDRIAAIPDARPENVDERTTYGGAIGIYWKKEWGWEPFSSPLPTFLSSAKSLNTDWFADTVEAYGKFHKFYMSANELAQAIKDEVMSALLHSQPLHRCTWGYIKEIEAQQKLQALRASGSQDLDEYIAMYDQEIEAKEQHLQNKEREIQQLRSKFKASDARAKATQGTLLKLGREQDFYPNETLSIVLDAINKEKEAVQQDSRRQHVLMSILEANPLQKNIAKEYREQLKELCREARTIDAKLRRWLESIGFLISDDGKHFKLTYHEDDRYTFSFPKSGSDWRGGLNAASDIGNRLF